MALKLSRIYGRPGAFSFLHRLPLSRCVSSSSQERPAGTLYICGTGEYNKLGVGDLQDREAPALVEELRDVPIVHVACGKYHTAAVSASGDVYTWGLESSGQLGLGSSKTKAATPQKVEALSGMGVKQLSCGSYHTLALTDAGEVYSFGFGGSFFNGAGGLGHGDRRQLDTPRRIETFGPERGIIATSVGAGGYHSIVLDSERRVWSWGRGEWGRLGFGDSSDVLDPQHLEECDGYVPISSPCGEAHSACLAADGRIFTWGRNEHWQLGFEVVGLLNSGQSFDSQAEPTQVPFPDECRCIKVSCGELGTAALMEDKSLWMWGMRRFFEPTALPGMEIVQGQVTQLECGASHLALLTDFGKVYTYGKGTALAMKKADRKSWELAEVTALPEEGRKVVSIACGSNSTALILES
mmetsp:Transcript_29534/g.48956  ORF Transcript_29534/g.48956 Transcript_29534/m.48956 type:complete len:411 (+) Transcript_29534:46-1278(+)|eukprot:CAMPEP_0119330460 /NCGR_PEP_ID=MMETSP1333-20130426/78327_1 /TAXON_ID=418940 /ORGANISM="Scyphosphaera apsteinii, Strain RCC1455" /LENGTH=410 /DNA_ID=CAMNT_0007339855 /DNA_START=44 /DNA_END=1276 /DNA_ORIENTATION=-